MTHASTSPKTRPFNSPLEYGLRLLFVLDAAAGAVCDLQRLIAYDYLLVHSGDVEEGPASLHPPVPFRGGELLVKRDVLAAGLDQMVSKELLNRTFDSEGVGYSANAHEHATTDEGVQSGARAEAAKILALRADLAGAIENVEARRRFEVERLSTASGLVLLIDERVTQLMTPTLRGAETRLRQLVERRVLLEAARSDRDQLENLLALRTELESESKKPRTSATNWEALPAAALEQLCEEIEAVLKDWGWPGKGKVTFNQDVYDIVIDGQPRQSHGKGVRGVLYSAFAIGLLNFCRAKGRPHPGLVVIDSPLTAFSKQKRSGSATTADGSPVDPGVEARFWSSLTRIPPEVQVIIVENKAPPEDVAAAVNFTWFAGESAEDGERYGFFPPKPDFAT